MQSKISSVFWHNILLRSESITKNEKRKNIIQIQNQAIIKQSQKNKHKLLLINHFHFIHYLCILFYNLNFLQSYFVHLKLIIKIKIQLLVFLAKLPLNSSEITTKDRKTQGCLILTFEKILKLVMGNTSQCSLFSDNNQQYRLLGEEKHYLYGQIHHLVTKKKQQKHFAIKKFKFYSQNHLQSFQQKIKLYQQIFSNLYLTKAQLFIDPKSKPAQEKHQINQESNESKANLQVNPVFKCNENNFIFSSPAQEINCSQPFHFLNLNLQYLQEKNTLKSAIIQKSNKLNKVLENNKVNQNILIQLERKVKVCDYDKIDKLPHKQRSIMNLFYTEIQVLRMLDSVLTSLYGLKINQFDVDAIRPELFFTQNNQEIKYFFPQILQLKNFSNFEVSYLSLKKWLDEQKALFHHNWNAKQKQFIYYVHPDNLEKLSQMVLDEGQNNFVNFKSLKSKQNIQKQNIFALGLIMLQICLLEPFICSKLYNVSTCKSQQKKGPSDKKEIKYSFEKKNLTIKFNNSVLQKYLIQMKTRYSDEFVDLVESMILGIDSKQFMKENNHRNNLNYESIIEQLSMLLQKHISKLKEVYSQSNKSKSKSKTISEKQSRRSSLTKQVSFQNISHNNLSSSSSFSIFPVQSQQKISSAELLKKNCSKFSNKANKILIKSQLQTFHESFGQKESRLQSLIQKDQERILSQLNQLNKTQNNNFVQKRFGYRKILGISSENELKKGQKNENIKKQMRNLENIQFDNYGDFKINTPASILAKIDSISLEKQKRVKSSTKIKKGILQKAKQQQSLGNSVCQTIYLYKQKERPQQSFQTVKNKNFDNPSYQKTNKYRQIEPFQQVYHDSLNVKSELKDLMASKEKKNKNKDESFKVYENEEEKSPQQLKSSQLYQLYLKQYRNLVEIKRKNQN